MADLWWRGQEWLIGETAWSQDITTIPTPEAEGKAIRQVMAVAISEDNVVEQLVEKYQFTKIMKITAWMRRFANNSVKMFRC